MDYKDKIIIICLFAIACLLAILKMICVWTFLNRAHEQEPEPANEIMYNVVDDNGNVIGGFTLKK